jgi:hypothetical protein
LTRRSPIACSLLPGLVVFWLVLGLGALPAEAATDPCQMPVATPQTYAHVVVIMEENLS